MPYESINTSDPTWRQRKDRAWQSAIASLDAQIAAAFGRTAVNIKDPAYGAVGDGATDDTAAIQAAIDAAEAAGGGIVWFPIGRYKTTAELGVGNGTATDESTVSSVVLVGDGSPPSPGMFTGYTYTNGVEIIYDGASSGAVLSIGGPLDGWGLENIALDGNGKAEYGLFLTSARFGRVSDVAIKGCTLFGLLSTTHPIGAFSNVDSLHNSFGNVSVLIPDTTVAGGVKLTGQAGGSNTDYSHFSNLAISFAGNSFTNQGLVLSACDTNYFYNTHIFNAGSNAQAVVFDYSVVDVWPASNQFFGIDVGDAAQPFLNVGTPNSTPRPNLIHGVATANSAFPPNLTNVELGIIGKGVAKVEFIRKAADEVVNNSTTLQNDDDFSFAIAANEIVQARMVLIYDSSTTADLKAVFTVPSGCTARASVVGLPTTAATVADLTITLADVTANFTAGGLGVASFITHNMDLIFVNSSTAGVVQFQWAQNALDATDTTIRANSHMLIHRAPVAP